MDLRVFLVEDLQSMRSLVEEACAAIGGLRLEGSASTEAEAKLWLQDHAGGWDLAIIDLVLAQGSGLGVLSACAWQSAHGRIAVFSSYVSPGIRTHCLALGADAVFDKTETKAFQQWLDEQARGGARPSP